MKRVIIESPFAGDRNANPIALAHMIQRNKAYARACVRDALMRREAPLASHLLYTQTGILNDEVAEEREWGIEAGLAWRSVSELHVFYIDRGWSPGMRRAYRLIRAEGLPYEIRKIEGPDAGKTFSGDDLPAIDAGREVERSGTT